MSDFEFRDDAEIKAVFNFEVGREQNDHNLLYNKSLPNQHPIEAITGLSEKVTNFDTHIADKNNPHEVTKSQVGLGNVDNTSDADKPVSTAMQSALDLKVNTADLGNAELDIQKNGTSVGKFTANASTDKVINLIVPTQASDVNALPDTTKYSASLVLSINSSTYVVTAQLKDQNGDNLGSAQTIDLPLESVVVNGSYDSINQKIILTLQNGNTIEIPVADLIAGLQTEITSDNKLSADLVDDNGQTNKFVTASEKSQISTNASNITALQSGKADKATTLSGYGITDAYTKTQVDTSLADKANIGLDNLSADGQMVIDSQNGTISNCILDIPQNIKLELSGGVVTLKAGSVITLAQSTYATITTSVNKTYDTTGGNHGTFFVFIDSSGRYLSLFGVDTTVSGATDSLAGTSWHTWFDTTNKVINRYSSDASTPSSTLAYPLCVIIRDSNGIRFAKDSNGNDMIFNGACFVGHHIVKYPNIKALVPKGLNTDGSMSSYNVLTASLEIIEMRTNINFCTITNSGSSQARVNYREVDELDDVVSSQYLKPQNLFYFYAGTNHILRYETPFVFFTYDGTTVTQFDMVKPVRTATVEMLKDKQNDLTTVSGYDATATQVLKNINGVLTWVTEE